MIAHDRLHERAPQDSRFPSDCPDRVSVEVAQLDQQAFAQIPSSHAGRIEGLDVFENRFDLLHRGAGFGGNLVQRCPQIAIVIQVADDHLADTFLATDQSGEGQLPEEMVLQRSRLGQRLIVGGELILGSGGIFHVASPTIAVEVVLPPGGREILGGIGAFRLRLLCSPFARSHLLLVLT